MSPTSTVNSALAANRARFLALIEEIKPLLNSDIEQALLRAQELISLSQRMGDKERAEALLQLGNVQLWMTNYTEAFDSLSEALRYANDTGDGFTIAMVRNTLGVIHQKVGDTASALSEFQEALTWFRAVNDTKKQAMVLHNIGVEYRLMGNFPEARACHEEVAELDRANGDRQGEARTLSSLGNVFYYQNEFDTARSHYKQALTISEQVGDIINAAQCCENLAEMEILRRDFGQAEQYLARCLTFCEMGNMPGIKAMAFGTYGKLFSEQQAYTEAREKVAQCIAEAEPHGLRRVLSDAYQLQVTIDEKTGNWEAALHAFRTYHELYRAMQTEEAERKARTISVQLQIAQSRWEAEQHRTRSESLAIENAVLIEAAHTDKLTGLPNRRYFEPRLQQAMHRSHTENEPFSLAVFDIDFFKKINDSLSHVGGDAVLKEVGAILRENCRSGSDTPARFGGEEFVLLFQGVTADVALERCEQIRKAIEDHPWRTVHAGLPGVTISGGVCDSRTHPDGESEALFAIADGLLYEAKRGGRNQVRCG